MKWNSLFSISLFRLLFLFIIHEHKFNFKILLKLLLINKLQERFGMICWMDIICGDWCLISLMYCECIWRIKLLFWQFVNAFYVNCKRLFHWLDYQIQIGLSNVFVYKSYNWNKTKSGIALDQQILLQFKILKQLVSILWSIVFHIQFRLQMINITLK